MEARELHDRVERAFNAGDVDALVELYEPDARMVRDDGSIAHGIDAIREIWAGFASLGGRMTLTTRSAVEAGDIALLSNAWKYEGAAIEVSFLTAEVARRDADGTWRYVIDNPFAATPPGP